MGRRRDSLNGLLLSKLLAMHLSLDFSSPVETNKPQNLSALNFGDRFTTTGPVQSVHQLDCDQIFSTCFSGVET
jgi:hypothetical protein